MDNNLSAILGKKMIKVSDVARNTGLSRTTLTRLYYKRTKSISGDTMTKLCKYLNITPGELLNSEIMKEGE